MACLFGGCLLDRNRKTPNNDSDMSSMSETLNFGKRGGLPEDALIGIILNGPLACPIFQMKSRALAEGCYDPNFPLKHAMKDLKFVIDTAYETGAPVPVGQLLLQLYSAGVNKNRADLDVCAIMKVLESLCSKEGQHRSEQERNHRRPGRCESRRTMPPLLHRLPIRDSKELCTSPGGG